jgi:rod shape-determining protein MreB
MFPFSASQNLAIDLGNNNTLITDQTSLLLAQPSCMVIDENTNRVEAVGNKAYDMLEKVHHHLKPIKPMKGGVISDGESAKRMLKELVAKVHKRRLLGNRFNYLLSGIPYDTTPVEKRALRDALEQFTSSKTHLIYEPLAAALGMGLSINEPEGKLIVDIGGGITEVVVISLSGIAAFQSTKIAGDHFDEEIRDHFRKEYNMAIGLKTAELLKINLGCVHSPLANPKTKVAVTGKDLMEGIPMKREISEVELCNVLNRSIQKIEESIHHTLEVCPPELAADIFQHGIYVTGGNALLKGVKERFTKAFQIPVTIDPNSLISVSKGISKVLTAPQKFQSVLF